MLVETIPSVKAESANGEDDFELFPSNPTSGKSSKAHMKNNAGKRLNHFNQCCSSSNFGFREMDILLEYKNLSHFPYDDELGGLFVMPSQDNIFVWFGLLFVYDQESPYRGAIIKFQLNIPAATYPQEPPTIFLLNELFHPLVHMSNAVSLRHAFPVWYQYHHSIYHVLRAFKAAFSCSENFLLSLQESQCPEKSAFALMRTDLNAFKEMAGKASALISGKDVLLDNVPGNNPIRIFDLAEAQFEQLKKEMIASSVVVVTDHRANSTSKNGDSTQVGSSGIVRVLSGLGKLILG